MKTELLRFGMIGFAVLMLSSAYRRPNASSVMAETAKNFLAALTPEQRSKVTFAFQDDERLNWHFVPRPRKGLPLLEMTPPQKHLAQALLSAGLSQRGLIKAHTIMSLEEILKILENDSGERRNPEKYYFSIFGEPSSEGVWGYRVEGHHLSLNFTVVDGRVAGSPDFFGANPAEVRQGPRKGLRALAAEEDLARDLLDALDEKQRAIAIVDAKAYPDILTEASRKAALQGQPNGLPVTRMTARQKELLSALVTEYAHNLPEQLAQTRMEQVQKAGDKLFFAWAGSTQRGGPHYYRVQGPTFLIEYDNTQNNANHIHSVWRDFHGDFGEDLLKRHYETAPHHKK